MAGLLRWSQSKVNKLLTGQVALTVDDLYSLCFAAGLHITEVVRDRGLEFLAEMTPTELRLLERFRQFDSSMQDVFLKLMNAHATTAPQVRRALPKRSERQR